VPLSARSSLCAPQSASFLWQIIPYTEYNIANQAMGHTPSSIWVRRGAGAGDAAAVAAGGERGEKAWLDENGVECSLNAPEGLVQSVS
jgi:hypothetical protein